MVKVRRLIETPACKRFVHIDARDFLMSERDLARKYGVPWYSQEHVLRSLWLGLFAIGMVGVYLATTGH